MSETISPDIKYVKEEVIKLQKETAQVVANIEMNSKEFSIFSEQGRKEIVRVALKEIELKFNNEKIGQINALTERIKKLPGAEDIRDELKNLLEKIKGKVEDMVKYGSEKKWAESKEGELTDKEKAKKLLATINTCYSNIA